MRRQVTTVPQAARGSSVSCICGTLSYAPQLDELAQRFEGREVLQYLLIDDDIQGAACGHWRIRAHDVEDVVINDELEERWREETIEAVRRRYPSPEQHVLACNGEPL